jgi:hypothetical protein
LASAIIFGKGFNIKVKDYFLKGVLDRVDVLGDTGRLLIIKLVQLKMRRLL